MKNIFFLIVLVVLYSCKTETQDLEKGSYRAVLKVNDTLELPFNFDVLSSNTINIYNADEIIKVDEIEYKNDSVYIKLPVFEGFITAKIDNKQNLKGFFKKEMLNRAMFFKAEFNNKERFKVYKESTAVDVSGNWETVFSPNSKEDTYIAKGTFSQMGSKVIGTFRTTTGDYRFLEGVLDGKNLKLSTFDGAHAFLFNAKVADSTMKGMFYSENHWQEPFTAKRNDDFELPDANNLTFLKEGFDSVNFSFPDETGATISLEDARFQNKVVLVQIMGTWCPNCLDESKFYSEFYKNNHDKGIEIVALAFEYAKTPEVAFKNIKRLKANTGISYSVLLAQYGSSSKLQAQEKLPMLNHVLSYPTTIYIDKTGKVRKIHTGFNGPATGEKYTEFIAEFNQFVNDLLLE
jgi:thiol-disulfide isomerase/thioredoxin